MSKAQSNHSPGDFTAYFISDVHLGSMAEPRSQDFLQFLKKLNTTLHVTHLFWVGDIFDLWVADHAYFVNEYQPIIAEIERLVSGGVEIHYFEGNHDLYLKKFWQDKLGVNIHPGVSYFELGEFTVRVEHGDQVDPDDKGYLFLRWFLRTPFMKVVAHHLPGPAVAWIGAKASQHSRQYTSTVKTIDKSEAIEKLRSYAQSECQKKPFDLMVSGHIHVTDDFTFAQQPGKTIHSINLGTWLQEPTLLRLSPKGTDKLLLPI